MNPTPENETPLTDAAWERTFAEDCRSPYTDMRDFARELERDRKRLLRELNRATRVLDDLGYTNTAARFDRISKASLALDAKLLEKTK